MEDTTLHTALGARASDPHDSVREGVRLGLAVGVVTWLWVATIDYVVGAPFQTILALGWYGFTALHVVLCVAYGIAIMSAVHASMTEPTFIYALIFSWILFHAAFVMLTIMLAIGDGPVAWLKFFAGNLISAALAVAIVTRRHPLLEIYRRAAVEA